jgi:hypothetical protein
VGDVGNVGVASEVVDGVIDGPTGE